MTPYTLKRLEFGSNDVTVPCNPDLLLSNEPFAPISHKLVDCGSGVWDLVFTYEAGKFYLPNRRAQVPGIEGATIEAWYTKEGNGTGPHFLAFLPFVIDESGGGSFGQATHFVDFSAPTPLDGSINTDTIPQATVTGTVHADLPEYSSFSISSQATNQSVIIDIKTTQAQFQDIFVYAGDSVPIGNTLTVAKGKSCSALAVFKKTTQTSSSEIGTIQFPSIPKSEWPMIVSEVVQQVLTKGSGDIYEFLSARLIASLGPEAGKTAVADISRRIESLAQLKTVISGLAARAAAQ